MSLLTKLKKIGVSADNVVQNMTHRCKKKNYKHLCFANVNVFWLNTLHWLV